MTAAVLPSWHWQSYQRLGPDLVFHALGTPVPQGSIRSLGKGRPSIHSNAARLKPWREHVQTVIEDAMPLADARFPLTGPVGIDLTFTMAKPKSAPKRRRTFPVTRPDLDKLLRCILDAGTAAGVWRDDSQIIDVSTCKVYPLEGAQSLRVPGVRGYVYTIAGGDPE